MRYLTIRVYAGSYVVNTSVSLTFGSELNAFGVYGVISLSLSFAFSYIERCREKEVFKAVLGCRFLHGLAFP